MEVNCLVKNVERIIGVVLLFVSGSGYGAALGQPQRTSMLGYAIGVTQVNVDDPAGDTDTRWALHPLTLIYTARLWSNGIRYWSELYHYQTTLDPGPTKIGQDVERYGMRLSLQKSLPVTPGMTAWFGAGFDLSHTRYSTRHTVDDEGFLIRAYPDRDETGLAGILNMSSEWAITRDWMIGAKFEHSVPIDGQITESLLAMSLLYRY